MSDQACTAVYVKQDDGSYVAYVAEIEGINTQGETLEEAEENLRDAADMVLTYRREQAVTQKNAIRKPFALA